MVALTNNRVEVVSFFVADLHVSKGFYTRLLRLPVVYEDEVSCVVRFSNLLINLLDQREAATLIEPAQLASGRSGPQAMLTIAVDDVRGMQAMMLDDGVEFLNGPIDRPWGRRTAAFADPDGNVWELAEEI